MLKTPIIGQNSNQTLYITAVKLDYDLGLIQ